MKREGKESKQDMNNKVEGKTGWIRWKNFGVR